MVITPIKSNDPILLSIANVSDPTSIAIILRSKGVAPEDMAVYMDAKSQLDATSTGTGSGTSGSTGSSSSGSSLGTYALAAPGIISTVSGMAGKGTSAATKADTQAVINAKNTYYSDLDTLNAGPTAKAADGTPLYGKPDQNGEYDTQETLSERLGDKGEDSVNIGKAQNQVEQDTLNSGNKSTIGKVKGWFGSHPNLSVAISGAAFAGSTAAEVSTVGTAYNTPTAMNAVKALVAGAATAYTFYSFATAVANATFLGTWINTVANFIWMHPWLIAVFVAAVAALSLLANRSGSNSDDLHAATGDAINNMLSQIPDWTQTLPSASVAMMAAGLTLGGMSYSLTPNSLYQSFSVPTVQLQSAIQSATGQATNPNILVQQGAGPNGTDTVYVVNQNGNMSNVTEFNVNKNGYVVGKKGPDQSYLPFFEPTVDNTGKLTGYKSNPGALNAILQVPACTAIANNSAMDPETREAALETCMRNNKSMQFIPLPS